MANAKSMAIISMTGNHSTQLFISDLCLVAEVEEGIMYQRLYIELWLRGIERVGTMKLAEVGVKF